MDIPSSPGGVPNNANNRGQGAGGSDVKGKTAFEQAMKRGATKQSTGETRAGKRSSYEKGSSQGSYQTSGYTASGGTPVKVMAKNNSDGKDGSKHNYEEIGGGGNADKVDIGVGGDVEDAATDYDQKSGNIVVGDEFDAINLFYQFWGQIAGDNDSLSVDELRSRFKGIVSGNPPDTGTVASLDNIDEVRAIAEYYLNHDGDLQSLSSEDGSVSQETLIKRMDNLEIGSTEEFYLKIISANWATFEGAAAGDLSRISSNTDNGQNVRNAADFFEENIATFDSLNNTSTYYPSPKGTVDAEDVYAKLKKADAFTGDARITAEEFAPLVEDLDIEDSASGLLKTVAKYWGDLRGDDDKLDLDDIAAFLNNDNLQQLDHLTGSPDYDHASDAARSLRDDPALRTMLAALAPSSASADSVSADALYAGLEKAGLLEGDGAMAAEDLSGLARSVSFKDGERAGLKTLAQNWEALSAGDGLVSVQDLRNEGFSELAGYFENNPGRFKLLRAMTRNDGSKDAIAADDVNAALKQAKLFEGDNAISEQEFRPLAEALGFEDGERAGLKALAANWGELAGDNGETSWQALTEAVDSADPELAAAAEYLTTNYDRLQALRSLADAGSPNAIAAEDLNAALKQAKLFEGDNAISDLELGPLARALPISQEEKSKLTDLAKYWDELSGGDDAVTRETLEKIGVNSDAHATAQYFLKNRTALIALDTAGGGKADGHISTASLYKRLEQAGLSGKRFGAIEVNDKQTATELLRWNWDKLDIDGGLTMAELKKITGDNPPAYATNRIKAASQYFVDNPDVFDEVAGSGSSDKKDEIRAKDIGAEKSPITERQALETLRRFHTKLSGDSDTITIAQGFTVPKWAGPELKAAIQYMKDNPESLKRLGLVTTRTSDQWTYSKADLDVRLGQVAEPADERAALDTLIANWPRIQEGDGGVSEARLQALASSDYGGEVANAAKYLLNNPRALAAFKEADDGDPSVIEFADLAAKARRMPVPESQASALDTLARNFDDLAGGADWVAFDKLQTIAEDTSDKYDPGVQQAAAELLYNPSALAALDQPTDGAGRNRGFTRTALAARGQAMSSGESERNALKALAENWQAIIEHYGKADKITLEQITELAGNNAPEFAGSELKAAAAYFESHRTRFLALETANRGAPNNEVTKGDLTARLGNTPVYTNPDDISIIDDKAALQVIAKHWNAIAGSNGAISRDAINQIAKGDPPDAASDQFSIDDKLRAAAQYLVDNSESFDAAATASVYGTSEATNSKEAISLKNLSDRARAMPIDDKEREMLKVINGNWVKLEDYTSWFAQYEGVLGIHKGLEKARDDADPELGKAADYFLDENPLALVALESANQGEGHVEATNNKINHGKIYKEDVDARMRAANLGGQSDAHVNSELEALDAIAKHWEELTGGDGVLNYNKDIRGGVNGIEGKEGSDYDRIQSAFQYILDHTETAKALGGENYKHITKEDFAARAKAIASDGEQRQAIIQIAKYWDELRGDDQKMDLKELDGARNGKLNNSTPQLEQAAEYLYQHRSVLFAMNLSGPSHNNPEITTAADLDTRMEELGISSERYRSAELNTTKQAAQALASVWNQLIDGGEGVTRAQIEKLASNDPPAYATKEVRAAAQYLEDNPDAFKVLAGASLAKKNDKSFIATEDLAAYARSLPIDNAEIEQINNLFDNEHFLNAGSGNAWRELGNSINGLFGDKGFRIESDLKAARSYDDAKPLQEAANYYFENPLKMLALQSSYRGPHHDDPSGEWNRGKIYRVDVLSRVRAAGTDPYTQNYLGRIADAQTALDRLAPAWKDLASWHGGDSTVDVDTDLRALLKTAAYNPDDLPDFATPEFMQAIQYLMDHKGLLDAMGKGQGGKKASTKITTEQFTGYLSSREASAGEADALATLDEYWASFADSNGQVDVTTLSKIADGDNTNASAEVREAARFFVNHRSVFAALETAPSGAPFDGILDRGDLDKRMADLGIPTEGRSDASIDTIGKALDALAGNWDATANKNGKLGKQSLMDLRSDGANPSNNKAVRSAADYLRQHLDQLPNLLQSGSVTKQGIAAAARGLKMPAAENKMLIDLSNYWEQLSEPAEPPDEDGDPRGDSRHSKEDIPQSGEVTIESLKKAAKLSNDAVDPAARSVARYLLKHRAAFLALDSATKKGGLSKQDGKIDLDGLTVRYAAQPLRPGEIRALKTLAAKRDTLNGMNRGDKRADRFTEADLRAIRSGDYDKQLGKSITDELKDAASYMLRDNTAALRALDVGRQGDGTGDGVFSTKDLTSRLRKAPLSSDESLLAAEIAANWSLLVKKSGSHEGDITERRLREIANDDNADETAKALASELLERPALLRFRLQVGSEQAKPDSVITHGELGAALGENLRLGSADRDALSQLQQGWDKIAAGESLTRGKLEKFLESKGEAPTALRNAVQHLLERPYLLDFMLDAMAGLSRSDNTDNYADGKFTKSDVKALLAKPANSGEAALDAVDPAGVTVRSPAPYGSGFSLTANSTVWQIGDLQHDAAVAPKLARAEGLATSMHYANQLSAGKTVQDILGKQPAAEEEGLLRDAYELIGISDRQLKAYMERAGGAPLFEGEAATEPSDKQAEALHALHSALRLRAAVDGGSADTLSTYRGGDTPDSANGKAAGLSSAIESITDGYASLPPADTGSKGAKAAVQSLLFDAGGAYEPVFGGQANTDTVIEEQRNNLPRSIRLTVSQDVGLTQTQMEQSADELINKLTDTPSEWTEEEVELKVAAAAELMQLLSPLVSNYDTASMQAAPKGVRDMAAAEAWSKNVDRALRQVGITDVSGARIADIVREAATSEAGQAWRQPKAAAKGNRRSLQQNDAGNDATQKINRTESALHLMSFFNPKAPQHSASLDAVKNDTEHRENVGAVIGEFISHPPPSEADSESQDHAPRDYLALSSGVYLFVLATIRASFADVRSLQKDAFAKNMVEQFTEKREAFARELYSIMNTLNDENKVNIGSVEDPKWRDPFEINVIATAARRVGLSQFGWWRQVKNGTVKVLEKMQGNGRVGTGIANKLERSRPYLYALSAAGRMVGLGSTIRANKPGRAVWHASNAAMKTAADALNVLDWAINNNDANAQAFVRRLERIVFRSGRRSEELNQLYRMDRFARNLTEGWDAARGVINRLSFGQWNPGPADMPANNAAQIDVPKTPWGKSVASFLGKSVYAAPDGIANFIYGGFNVGKGIHDLYQADTGEDLLKARLSTAFGAHELGLGAVQASSAVWPRTTEAVLGKFGELTGGVVLPAGNPNRPMATPQAKFWLRFGLVALGAGSSVVTAISEPGPGIVLP